MPRTYSTCTSLIFAVALLAAAACADGPVRPTESPTQPERVIDKTVNGKAVRIRYDGKSATLIVDGRTTMRVRYDGELRHVTAYFANGRTYERTYTRRELAEAAASPIERPSLEVYDYVTDKSGESEELKCSREWVAFAGAALVAVITCEATGPTPPCAAAVSAAAVALDAVITCEKRTS